MSSVKNRFVSRYIILILLLIISIVLICFGFIKKEFINVKYSEDNSINYKVYLHKNNYFNTPYLDENRTYIANLINYIDIKFNYNLKLSEKINGNYKYSVMAKVKANKTNGEQGYYWSKDYVLVPSKMININNNDVVSISENVKVDYNKYNEILNSFKKEYSIQTEGLLDIVLNVQSTGTGKVFTEPIDITSDLSLNVPLLEKAVEANINKNAKSHNNTITMVDRTYSKYHLISGVSGIILLLIAIILFINTMYKKKKFVEENIFDVTLNKILASHDSIIANVSTLPEINDMKLIEVTTFNELIDVYNEVRMPINYYKDDNGEEATFLIVNDNMAWRFILDKTNLEHHIDYKNENNIPLEDHKVKEIEENVPNIEIVDEDDTSVEEKTEVEDKKEEVSVNAENDSNVLQNDLKNTSKFKFTMDLEKTLNNLNLFNKTKDHGDEEK